ncbi:MAG TPA: multiheme c-type cytochrome [Gemmatimonadales bacterium]|nr:multiheme c-type cytochrome [Gemmatimonadales bacterium]
MKRPLLLSAFLLTAPAAALAAQQAAPDGTTLFITKGCLGCHGASGRGGVGPVLAGTALSLDAFVHQLRQPRQFMPRFPAEVVSDAEATAIREYLQRAPAPPSRLLTNLPHGSLDPKSCAPCHAKLEPTIVRQFEASAMGRPGMQDSRVIYPIRQITCADCHGRDHDAIMASKGRVPEVVCGGCHAQIYKEHVLDVGHSYGPGPGNLGVNWERNIGVPHYKEMPRKVMEMGCDACHAQAGASDQKYWSDSLHRYVDLSSLVYRNGCIACHTRHSFSLEEARKPEACYTCHMGPDHPNYESYMASKHGSIYVARGKSWDWAQFLDQATYDTPTCAYCHMVYVSDGGVRSVSHNMTRKIIWGMGVQAASGALKDLASAPEGQAKRKEMIKVCMTCHSEDKARGYLESADAHKLAGDALVTDARGILAGLYHDGLIRPSHAATSAGLLPGPRFTALELPGSVAQHSPTSLYYDVTPIEREYFDMFFFSALKSYKGAFHMSPDYAWWYGYADELGHLATIRDDAERLRSEEATRKRTLFMIFTGPLMVLAVLGAVYLIWRARRGRAQP